MQTATAEACMGTAGRARAGCVGAGQDKCWEDVGASPLPQLAAGLPHRDLLHAPDREWLHIAHDVVHSHLACIRCG